MSWISAEALQYIAWFMGVIEFILALYILFLNVWHRANQHVGGLLLLFSVNTLALGMLLGGGEDAWIALPLRAATTPAIEPALLIVSAVLLKPAWLPGGVRPDGGQEEEVEGWRWQWQNLWWIVYGLCLVPMILTLLDVTLDMALWYTPPDAVVYGRDYLSLTEVTGGILSVPLRLLTTQIMGLGPVVFILFLLWRDRRMGRTTRRLAWLLLGAQVVVLIIQLGLRETIGATEASFLSAFVFVVVYAYAAFRQMISERRMQRGRLQVRLTILVLAAALPVLLAVTVFISSGTLDVLIQDAQEQLRSTNRSLSTNVSLWLDLSVQSLQQLATLPEVVSMDPERQKPILEQMVATYPYLTLVSTIDVDGNNVARSDDLPLENYRRQYWHIGARNGVPITFDVVQHDVRQQPVLVMAVPIRRELGTIVGVAMVAGDLDAIAQEVQATRIGDRGFAYVVDGLNRVVAHPDAAYSAELRDLGYYAPVFALRAGERGLFDFTDEEGQEWQAYLAELDNGWGVIVQQPLEDLLAPVRRLRTGAGVTIGIGAVVLLLLVSMAIRQVLRPIDALIGTATAIAAGDIHRVAPVESEDEVGTLARAFNSMTEQLRGLIGGLEQQVADRTQELERRSAYLEATTEIGQAVTSILERERLIRQVVDLIRDRFDLYYVGLFLLDEFGEWAVLQAGTGAAGQALMERGHRIPVGEGMIGWAVAHGQARVAELAGADAVRLATPELPETRSEAALPLRSREQVLGALTVQHAEPGAFDEDTIAVLQTMADQVAVALDNASLFAESQEALDAARRAYGEVSRRTWAELMRTHPDWGYLYSRRQVVPVEGEFRPELLEAEETGQTVVFKMGQAGNGHDGDEGGEPSMAIPIKVRDEVVGVLGFRKRADAGAWSARERELLEVFAARLEVALESARLYQDTQRRAARDRLLADVVGRIRETLDVETVLRIAAQEVRQAMELPEVVVRLRQSEPSASDLEMNGGPDLDDWDVG